MSSDELKAAYDRMVYDSANAVNPKLQAKYETARRCIAQSQAIKRVRIYCDMTGLEGIYVEGELQRTGDEMQICDLHDCCEGVIDLQWITLPMFVRHWWATESELLAMMEERGL